MRTPKVLITIAFLFLFQFVYCDILPPDNSHPIENCILFTNIEDYPEISLIAFPEGMGSKPTYKLLSTECLKPLKNFYTYVSAVANDYLKDKEIDKLTRKNIKCALSSGLYFCPLTYLMDTIPINAIYEYYRIIGFTSAKVVIYKWKEINKFNNGRPDSITYYSYSGDSTLLSQKFTGIDAKQNNSTTELFPNPSRNSFHLKLNSIYKGNVSLNLLTVEGKVVKSLMVIKTGSVFEYELPVTGLANGTYFLKIGLGEAIETKMIVIK